MSQLLFSLSVFPINRGRRSTSVIWSNAGAGRSIGGYLSARWMDQQVRSVRLADSSRLPRVRSTRLVVIRR